MSLRTGLAALAWVGVLALAVVVTVRGIISPEVHWAVAMPQMFEPGGSGSSDAVPPGRPAASHDAVPPRTKPAASASSRPAALRPAAAARRASVHTPLTLRWQANPGSVRAFSPAARYMSLPAYVRYVVHQQTGRWITYAEAAKMVKDKTIPMDAAAASP